MEDDFHETKNVTSTSRRGFKLSSKEREENDAGFEDERDCAVQSAMTSHSEHLKDEDAGKTEEVPENSTSVPETPRSLEDETKNDNGDKSNEVQSDRDENEKEERSGGAEDANSQGIFKETGAVSEQNGLNSSQIIEDFLKGGIEQDDDDGDGDNDNEGKDKDLKSNSKTISNVKDDNDDTLQMSNTEDLETGQKTSSNGGNDEGIINEDPQGKDEDSRGNQPTNVIGENDEGMAYEDSKDNKQGDPKAKKNSDGENENGEETKIGPNSEEEHLSRYEGSEVSLHSYDRHSRRSTKYSPSTDSQHSNYDEQLSVDYSESEASSYHKNAGSKPLKRVVLAGLPPRKPLTILATKGDPKKNNVNREMKRVVQEILIRGDKKIKDLTTQAQSLRRTTEILSEENKAMKKLHKLQSREIQKMDDFVSMTTSRSKVVKKDVRNSEMTSVDMNINVRKQVKEILLLRRECERYEKLVEMDRKMPRRSVLQDRLEKVERQLESKDKELENLNKKVLAQQKKISQERQKENRKFAQLDEEIHGTIQECQELKTRLKEAERKIDKTNIYSRRSNATNKALPPSTSLPALTWHPPVHREKTRTKVKKWLNDSNNKHR